MNEEGRVKLKGELALAMILIFVSIMILSASTFAWFTFRTSTNITKMAGTVGTGGANLLISNSSDSGFDTNIDLAATTSETLQPVSTANLTDFYQAIGQNTAGISTSFQRVDDADLDSMTINGTFYLKSENAGCDIYFNTEAVNFGTNAQALAAYRLGFTVTTSSGTETLIFKLDSLGNTGGATSTQTMSESNVVVSGLSGNSAITVTDPGQDISEFAATVTETTATAGTNKIMTLQTDEVATVRYWLYLEGCDENSSNDVQETDIALQLGFVGVGN